MTRVLTTDVVELGTGSLSLRQLGRVADGASVAIALDEDARDRFDASREALREQVDRGQLIYGVNTAFGGMSGVAIPSGSTPLLQHNALMHNRAGAGGELPERHVRAGMLLRLNSHLRGASGIRWELAERLVIFLNAGATPVVRELGSIGASGDLVPLAAVARVVTGADPGAGVRYRGELLSAAELLPRLGLEPLELEFKEGLAMVNGTSMSTGIAACGMLEASGVLTAVLAFHALALQALCASIEPLDAFIHAHKPHQGQLEIAEAMRAALAGGQLTDRAIGRERLAQDRYSVRCLPQFLGPVLDTMRRVGADIETEMNSATDNPLVDAAGARVLHGGNFLAQYVSTGMDAVRAQTALMTKHVDAQLALMFAPEFSNGLPASLVGSTEQPANMGLKALQTCGNSIMPLVEYYGAPLAARFPTHAEQFNQNVNSQSYGSAQLAVEQLRLARLHTCIGLLCAMQAVELRAGRLMSSYDPRPLLAPPTVAVFEAVCDIVGHSPARDQPYCFDDGDRNFEVDIEAIDADLRSGDRLASAARAAGLAPGWEAVA